MPADCNPVVFLAQQGEGLFHIVAGFNACLGVPRKVVNDPEFISSTLEGMGVRHDRLLDLIVDVSDEGHFAALRLLAVCGVHRFEHIDAVVTTPKCGRFIATRIRKLA